MALGGGPAGGGCSSFAVLAHDFGKPATTASAPSAGGAALGEPGPRGRRAARSPRRSCAGSAPRSTSTPPCAALVVHHLAHHHGRDGDFTDAQVRRLARKLAPGDDRRPRARHGGRCDGPARRCRPAEILALDRQLRARAAAARDRGRAPRPIILGRHLVAMGRSPGPDFKPILDAAFEAQLDGAFSDEAGGVAWLEGLRAANDPPRFQWDLARQVGAARLAPRAAARAMRDWGYQELYLHLEDAVEFPSLPGVARRDAYSQPAIREARRRGGPGRDRRRPDRQPPRAHAVPDQGAGAARPERAAGRPTVRRCERGQVCPLHPRTLEVADALLARRRALLHGRARSTWAWTSPSASAGTRSARPRSPRSGIAAHFGRYVQRLHGVAGGRGLRLGIWADMLALLPGADPAPSPGHHRLRLVLLSLWAPAPDRAAQLRASTTLRPPCRARGIEYWGCPMNGAFRHEPLPVFGERLANIRDWWRRCSAVGAGGCSSPPGSRAASRSR